MTAPFPRQETVSLADELLPPSWLESPTILPRPPEDVGGGLYTTGPDGVFRERLAEGIRGAQEVVLVASFLLSDPTIANALLSVCDRVRVYVLTASEQRLSGLPREDDLFEARRIDEHRTLLDQLAGRVTVRTAAHFHAKFVVVDPQSSPRGWISTANLNPALVDSVELGVELSARSAASLAGWFARAFWLEAERELAGKGRLAAVAPPPAVPAKPEASEVLVTTREDRTLAAEAARIIEQSSRSLIVCSYGIELADPIVQTLLARARAGVNVTVLTRTRPAVAEAAQALHAAGARVVGHEKLHAKAIVGDAGALVMTANLERQGMDGSFEVGVRMPSALVEPLERVLQQWVGGFPWRFSSRTRRGDHLGALLLANKRPQEGRREVIVESTRALPAVTAADALALHDAAEPSFPSAEDGAQIPQRVRYSWSVEPPRLPVGAREVQREDEEEVPLDDGARTTRMIRRSYDPPVFEHRGRRFVLLQTDEHAVDARRLAGELGATVVVP